MNYLEKTFIVQLFIRSKLKEFPGPCRNPDSAGVNLHAPQARPRSIGRQAQTRLAFSERLVRPLPEERIGEYLRDKLETFDERLRPGAFVPHRVKAQYTNKWLSPCR
jgi:hypothetical protein